MKPLTLGSLFDGSGGFPLGGLLCGITPVWASEIEPFPIRVTTKRLPDMQHLGDVSAVHGAEIPPVDIITFGSPCTDMSVAGKRAGLDGSQSVLFHEAIRIVREMREATNGAYPRYIVWENVPGAFSSNGGRDFKAVLEAVVQIACPQAEVPAPTDHKWPYADVLLGNGWSVAYRTVDAQHFGVAQRRRRIYLVADFAGECAGEILFERESVSGDSAAGDSTGQDTAGDACKSAVTAIGFEPGAIRRLGGHAWLELAGTLRADMGDNQLSVAYGIGSDASNAMRSDNPHSGIYEANTARTLDVNGGNPSCNQGGIAVVAFAQNQRDEVRDLKDVAGALAAEPGMKQQTYVAAFKWGNSAKACGIGQAYSMTVGGFAEINKEKAATLMARDYKDPQIVNTPMPYQSVSGTIAAGAHPSGFNGQDAYSDRLIPVQTAGEPAYAVRRLTPTECARLQGFPDWWCASLETPEPTDADIEWWTEVFETHRRIIGASGKPKSRAQIRKWLQAPHSDAAEYKMWGNGVALPCVVFVLFSIARAAEAPGDAL